MVKSRNGEEANISSRQVSRKHVVCGLWQGRWGVSYDAPFCLSEQLNPNAPCSAYFRATTPKSLFRDRIKKQGFPGVSIQNVQCLDKDNEVVRRLLPLHRRPSPWTDSFHIALASLGVLTHTLSISLFDLVIVQPMGFIRSSNEIVRDYTDANWWLTKDEPKHSEPRGVTIVLILDHVKT